MPPAPTSPQGSIVGRPGTQEDFGMKARRLWITAPFGIEVQAHDLSETPPPGHVLLESEKTLVSAGTELAIVTGSHIGFTTGAAWPRYPMALGYTALGRILRVGDGVQAWREGDRALAGTPHASHALADAATLMRVPEGIDAEAALLAHLASIPINGVRLTHPQAGEGMVVFGQGLIGALAARFGRAAGCRPVLGVDPLEDRRRLAERAAIVGVDPTRDDPARVHAELADGRRPEIVIEATGAPPVIVSALRAAGDMARVVLLGSPRGRVEIDPYTDVHRPGVTIIGAHARVAPALATPYNAFTNERNRQTAMMLIQDGSLPIDGLISHRIRPDEALATYRALADRAPGYMGVVVDWG
jgi:2-desacetyl-2-hydroxyethyl bacteriochlorophyllide A dehydrogenase